MKKQNNSPLLSKVDIENIFKSGKLYEKGSFYVINKKTKTYNTEINYDSFPEYAKLIREAFRDGHTIIVKNLEDFTDRVQNQCMSLGKNVNVHMYLVPQEGESSFDFHKDDRDVEVQVIYGEKKFILKKDNNIKEYQLVEGDTLFIKKGVLHKAIPNGASCLLSFGIEDENDYDVPFGINQEDLH